LRRGSLAEYVWLDAKQEARSKTKVIPNKVGVSLEELGALPAPRLWPELTRRRRARRVEL